MKQIVKLLDYIEVNDDSTYIATDIETEKIMSQTEFAKPLQLGDPMRSAHLYVIECEYTADCNRNGRRPHIDVFADNRAQAAKKAEREGFTVRSVNMIG